MSNTSETQQRWEHVMMNNYGTPPVVLAEGDGAVVTDVDGKRYLDLLGGIAVNVLGHRNQAVIDAVTHQLSTLGHTSNLYATGPGLELSEALVARLGVPGRVFLCNSGTEANEAAFKLTRLTGRTKVVAAEGAFHGRTMGSLALTGQPTKQAPFEPLPAGLFMSHTATWRPSRPRSTVTPQPSSWNRSWAKVGWWFHQRGISPGCVRSPRAAARCWCSMRYKPESAAPEHFSHTNRWE